MPTLAMRDGSHGPSPPDDALPRIVISVPLGGGLEDRPAGFLELDDAGMIPFEDQMTLGGKNSLLWSRKSIRIFRRGNVRSPAEGGNCLVRAWRYSCQPPHYPRVAGGVPKNMSRTLSRPITRTSSYMVQYIRTSTTRRI